MTLKSRCFIRGVELCARGFVLRIMKVQLSGMSRKALFPVLMRWEQVVLCEFEVTLVYTVISGIDRITY